MWIILNSQSASESPYSGIPRLKVWAYGPFKKKSDAVKWAEVKKFDNWEPIPVDYPEGHIERKEA